MQHDIFVNPNRRMREAYPFVVMLQSDAAEGPDRIVAPLAPFGPETPPPNGLPVIDHQESRYILMLTLLGSLPIGLLGGAVGSLRHHGDEIAHGLDRLFFGF